MRSKWNAAIFCLVLLGASLAVSAANLDAASGSYLSNPPPSPVPECSLWRDDPDDAIEPSVCTISQPWWTVWESCPITPVHTELWVPSTKTQAGLERIPWVEAVPESAGVIAHLYYGNRPLHTGGKFPDGVNAKVLWTFSVPVTTVTASATNLWTNDLAKPLFDGESAASLEGDWPSTLDIAEPGCWEVSVTGKSVDGVEVSGSVIFIVIGD